MTKEDTERVIEALINREYETVREVLHKLSSQRASFKPGIFYLVQGFTEMAFEGDKMLNFYAPLLLGDSIDKEKANATGKVDRYKSMKNFLLSPVNYLKSMPLDLLLSHLDFIPKGIEVETNGQTVKVSDEYVRDNVSDIADDFSELAWYAIRYVQGMRDAFKVARDNPAKYTEAVDIETFVKDERAELYALMRMLNPAITSNSGFENHELPMRRSELREKYEEFCRRFVTGPNGHHTGEYSHILNLPIDFLLTTAKAMVHVVGDEKRWSAVIRLFFQPEDFIHDTIQKLKEHQGMDEELRSDILPFTEEGYKLLEEFIMLSKESFNLTGKKVYERHMKIINTLGIKPNQRTVADRYSAKAY